MLRTISNKLLYTSPKKKPHMIQTICRTGLVLLDWALGKK